MKIKQEGQVYTFSDNISKTNKCSIISIISKKNSADLLHLKVAFDTLKAQTNTLSKQEFKKKRMELFDLRFNSIVADFYNNLIIEHEMSYIDDNYLPNQIREEAFELFKDYYQNKHIDEEELAIVLDAYRLRYKMLKNDFTKYATRITKDKLYEIDENYLTLAKEEELLENITPEVLEKALKEVEFLKQYVFIKTNSEEQFDTELVESNDTMYNQQYKVEQEFHEEIIDLQIDQAKLNLVYQFDENYSREQLNVFNLIFGGDSFSKLFMNVREQHSICYYVNSQILNRNLLYVKTGVNEENLSLAEELIEEQIRQIIEGDFDTELQLAKQKLISLYNGSRNDYYTNKNLVEKKIIMGEQADIDTIISSIKVIEKDTIITMANSLKKIKRVVVK